MPSSPLGVYKPLMVHIPVGVTPVLDTGGSFPGIRCVLVADDSSYGVSI